MLGYEVFNMCTCVWRACGWVQWLQRPGIVIVYPCTWLIRQKQRLIYYYFIHGLMLVNYSFIRFSAVNDSSELFYFLFYFLFFLKRPSALVKTSHTVDCCLAVKLYLATLFYLPSSYSAASGALYPLLSTEFLHCIGNIDCAYIILYIWKRHGNNKDYLSCYLFKVSVLWLMIPKYF